MGNRDSSPVLVASDSAPVEVVSPHTSHYRALYADLTSPDSQGDPVNKATFRVRHLSVYFYIHFMAVFIRIVLPAILVDQVLLLEMLSTNICSRQKELFLRQDFWLP